MRGTDLLDEEELISGYHHKYTHHEQEKHWFYRHYSCASHLPVTNPVLIELVLMKNPNSSNSCLQCHKNFTWKIRDFQINVLLHAAFHLKLNFEKVSAEAIVALKIKEKSYTCNKQKKYIDVSINPRFSLSGKAMHKFKQGQESKIMTSESKRNVVSARYLQ